MKLAYAYPALLVAVLAGGAAAAPAEKIAPETVLLENGRDKVTALDFDASMTRFPAYLRDEARAYPSVIMKNVDSLFVNRVAANRARDQGLDKDPLVQQRLKQLEEAFLAQKYLDYVYDNVKVPDLTARAEEIYKADTKRFTQPALVGLRHLLVSYERRTPEMALERAREAERRLRSGEDFAAVAAQMSDDQSVVRNGGDLGILPEAQYEGEIRAVFEKMKPGEISQPIATPSGVHIVQLKERRPARVLSFKEVKDRIVAEEEEKVRKKATEDFLTKVRTDPGNTIYQQRVEALRSEIDASKVDKAHRDAIEKIHTQ